MKVEAWNEKRNGKFTEHSLKRTIEKLGLTVQTVTYNKEVKLTKHKFAKETIVGVAVGKYEITSGGETFVLKPSDYLKVPANTEFDAAVTGKEDVIAYEGTK
jgi:quercetin dioxygenase-like cupin family protein